jgi:hypothetical protein
MSDPSATPSGPSAGWYPDPAGQGARYWDGTRWTEHTHQPAATPPAYASPAQPAAARAPVPAAPAGGTSVLQTFVDQLKRAEGTAIVLLCGVLVVIATFLPWAKLSIGDNQGGELSDTKSAWAGDVPWLVRGFGAEEYRVAVATQTGDAPSGGTDLVVLLPLVIVAGGLVVAMRQGKRVNRGRELVVVCSGLLALLLVLEIVHLGSWADDLQDAVTNAGGSARVTGGAAYGLYLATLAAAGMTFGAVRSLMAKDGPTGPHGQAV